MIRVGSALSIRSLLIALFLFAGLGVAAGCDDSGAPTPSSSSGNLNTSGSTPLAGTTPTQATGVGATENITAIEQDATTTSYKLHLHLGAPEQMTRLAEAKAKGVKSGKLVVKTGVTAAMMSGSANATPNRHLAVIVSDIKSGTVITDKAVRIDLTNDATSEVMPVPVATMYGAAEGPGNTHFGNNIALAPGNYTVKVLVGGEPSEFKLKNP